MKFELPLDSYKIVFLYDKEYLLIQIRDKNDKNNKFKDIKIQFEDVGDSGLNFEEFDELIQEMERNSEKKKLIRIITKDSGKKYLSILIKDKNENYEKTIENEIIFLNVKYYLTIGPNNKRIDDEPFYSHFDREMFNLYDIQEFIKKEKLDQCYYIDSFKMKNENGFYVKIKYDHDYRINDILELEFHCFNKIDNCPYLKKIRNDDNYTSDILKLNETINKCYQNMVNYDLIYLYASPIFSGTEENDQPISYREEINIILDIMKKKGKQWNCLFECMSIEVLREILISKKTKVLHISSHGSLELKNKYGKGKYNTKYSLILEDLDKYGEKQKYEENAIKTLLKCISHKIKNIDLIILSTCYSGGLEELFSEYNPKYIIYVDKYTKIGDYTSIKFTKYFYEELVKDRPIPECYETSKRKLKVDSDILFYNIDRCCCKHFHTCERFKIKNKNALKEFHNSFHLKSEKCVCKYDECHTHKKNCEFVSEEIKQKYIVEEKGDIVKICCCDPNISHNEILTIKLKTNLGINKRDNFKETKIFKYKSKGDIQVNQNVSTEFQGKKYYSIIGRKLLVKDIFEYIVTNKNGNFIIVLYGDNGLRKMDFAESTCVHLFERKIIHKYDKFIIDSEFDYEKMKNIICKNEKMNCNNKIVYIIKYITIETFEALAEKISKINNDNNLKCYKNIYFILICDLNLENKKEIDNNVKFFNAKIRDPARLIEYYCRLYNCSYSSDSLYHLGEELKKINSKPKLLEKIANLLAFENKSIQDIINIVKTRPKRLLKEYKKAPLIITEKNKEIYIQYYFISKFPSGLPDTFISLIFYKKEKSEIVNNIVKTKIKINEKNDWKFIEKDILFTDEENHPIDMFIYAKNYIIKAVKLYALLLDEYIDKNRNEINFKDYNIHIICNSYNSSELWKSHLKELEKEYNLFLKKSIDFSDKDFDINKHKENIYNIIALIINNFDKIIPEDNYINNKKNNIISYIEEILLLYPSAFFLKKSCKNIIQKCKYLCQKCIEYLKNNNKCKDLLKKFNRIMYKIMLFQYSIGEINNIEKLNDIDDDIKIELTFLRFLKSFETKEENKLTKMISNNIIIDKKKISLIYYEFSKKYFSIKDFKKSEQYLNKAIKNLMLFIDPEIKEENLPKLLQKFIEKFNRKEINLTQYNLEIKHLFRMIFDSFHLFKLNLETLNREELQSKIEEKITYLNEIILYNINSNYFNYNEGIDLRDELYNLKQPEIIMLNSNPLKNNISILSKGIYAYLNNQYHILKKLKESEKEINSYIRIQSVILNLINLMNALNNKGEILIIQSDDFSENGELGLEDDKGVSRMLKKQDFIKVIPVKINYKVVILCFKNSSKCLECFNNVNYHYLICFEYFDSLNFSDKILIEYNKLCIEFIIDFIKISSKYYNISTIFKEAKNNFINNINKLFINYNPFKEYIYLISKEKNKMMQLNYLKSENKIFL